MTTPELPPLDPEEYRRYGRHLTLPDVGEEGQRRLKAASVLVVGAGGLGCPAALYLAAAGVGRITLCDFDVVDPSNLQRQVLFGTDDVGHPKVECAGRRLRDLNPLIDVVEVDERVSAANVIQLVRSHDVTLDGTDNFTTRYLVNDACVLERKPYVYGSIFRFEGQASVFHAPDGPCYRCLFPEPPPEGLVPNCAQAGVLGVLPGIVGSIQALETLKLLLGLGPTLQGRLMLIDAMGAHFREVSLQKDPGCPLCGENPTITEAVETGGAACVDAGGDGSASPHGVSAADLAAELSDDIPPLLVDVREEWEFRSGALEGARHIPLGELTLQAAVLPTDRDLVVYCRVGPRGERAVEMLHAEGFTSVRNLVGGLVAWRDEVDPAVIVA